MSIQSAVHLNHREEAKKKKKDNHVVYNTFYQNRGKSTICIIPAIFISFPFFFVLNLDQAMFMSTR